MEARQRFINYVNLYSNNYELFVLEYKSNLEPTLLIFSKRENVKFVESIRPRLFTAKDWLIEEFPEATIEDDFGNFYTFGLDLINYAEYDIVCKAIDAITDKEDVIDTILSQVNVACEDKEIPGYTTVSEDTIVAARAGNTEDDTRDK